jgi:hypothetical protein
MVARGTERRGGNPKESDTRPLSRNRLMSNTCSLNLPFLQSRSATNTEANMDKSPYDETRATARLPNLDIEILHRRPWEGNEEQIVVMLRAVPSFEAFGRLLEASNPLLVWTRMMEAAWSPWVRGLTTAFSPSVRPPSLPGFDLGSHRRADP